MGTGSKSSHQSYAVSPTALAEPPAAPLDMAGPPTAGEGTDLTGAAAGGAGSPEPEALELPEPLAEPAPPAAPPAADSALPELDALLGTEPEPEPVVSATAPEEELQEASAEPEDLTAEGELQSSNGELPADEAVLLHSTSGSPAPARPSPPGSRNACGQVTV
ncbi:hypothetical protein ABT072_48660, partial [Streptomyces sp. NPDC002589]